MDSKLSKGYHLYFKSMGILGVFLVVIGLLMFLPIINYIITSEGMEVYDFFIFLILGLSLLLYGIYLRRQGKLSRSTVIGYTPKAGFKYFRKSMQARIKALKAAQFVFLPLMAILTFDVLISPDRSFFYMVFFPLCAIIFYANLKFMDKRIKLHDKLDDASYFELESLGLISEYEIVQSLYKDFLSWDHVKAGSKLLVLTQDNLIVLTFTDREKAQKLVFPLTKLDKLRILKYGVGYIITIGFQKDCLQIVLKGKSYQDSPEEFIALFLKEVDKSLLNVKKEQSRRTPETNPSPSTNANFRAIDFNIVDMSEELKNTVEEKPRIIEF